MEHVLAEYDCADSSGHPVQVLGYAKLLTRRTANGAAFWHGPTVFRSGTGQVLKPLPDRSGFLAPNGAVFPLR